MQEFKIFYYKTLSSTNEKCKNLISKGYRSAVVVADQQKKGRGRFGRKWNSEFGGLYATLLLKEEDFSRIKYLTLIVAVSVVKAIQEISKLKAKVKWPNDVLIENKKICGILTETVFGKENYALIGIGVNVNQNFFPKNLINKATSLKIVTNKIYDNKKFIKIILKNFNSLYKFYNKKDSKKIIDIWKKYSHTLGKNVKATTLRGTYTGKAVNIDEECNLILKLSGGKFKKIVEGDISVI